MAERKPLYRKDYKASPYKIPHVDLDLNILSEEKIIVSSTLKIECNPNSDEDGGPLVLDAEELNLESIKIVESGVERELDATQYDVADETLTIKNPPAQPFELKIQNEINPKANKKLMGIYMSGDVLGSQCEAEGFRRITPFLDRPDNLATFSVRMEADKEGSFPVLISNGNGDLTKTTDLKNGRHEIRWDDPFPKPSYLFATLGGDLHIVEGTFGTMSKKDVALRFAVQPGYEDKVEFAMESLKRAMKWDEEVYGLEYDLDVFHVAALDKFIFGAMENKSLNIFNVSALVGDIKSSTDDRLIYVDAVIAHEYFHNWTGNRVTCRDWFQLTLKEGLTVLRDRQYTEDTYSKAIKRIDDALALRAHQFTEDSGPMSHPIRPDKVEVFDNIYSSTVYEKGSHVLGMLKTIVGDDNWYAGMKEYFKRFDGQAVTCDDFIDAHEDTSGIDMTQFRQWYSQSGTPEISYKGVYDEDSKTYTLTLSQHTPATADQAQDEKKPLHIPIAVGLIGESGKDAVETKILHLTQEKQEFVFDNINGPVVPSVLRDFSAPVKIVTKASDKELLFRMAYDSDPYNKHEAINEIMLKTLTELVKDQKNGTPLKLPQHFIDAYGQNLSTALDGDLAFSALSLSVPSYSLLTQELDMIDPDAIETVSEFVRNTLAEKFKDEFQDVYDSTKAPDGEKPAVVQSQIARRALHNLALAFIGRLKTPEAIKTVSAHFNTAETGTDQQTALKTLCEHAPAAEADRALEAFYQEFRDNPTSIDTYFATAANRNDGDVQKRTQELLNHPDYDNTTPNRVRAFVGGYLMRPARFHATDGSGYKFLADAIIEQNNINPSTGARLAGKFTEQFEKYDAQRRALMVTEMERVMALPDLDEGAKEVIGKTLDMAKKKPELKQSGNTLKPKSS